MGEMLAAFLGPLVSKYPLIASVIAMIGVARLIVKPIMVALKSISDSTENKKDDALYLQAENSAIYKALVFVMDLAFSLKLPVK